MNNYRRSLSIGLTVLLGLGNGAVCMAAEGDMIIFSSDESVSVFSSETETDENSGLSERQDAAAGEKEEDWERTVQDVQLSGDFSEDLLAVAGTQVGYQESRTDYMTDENGEVQGYSRYAAWEGLYYGDWNVMFTEFCLYYAGIPMEAVPSDLNPEKWKSMLKEQYLDADEGYVPEPGDIVFFYTAAEETEIPLKKEEREKLVPDRTGIVTGGNEQKIQVIEGDCQGMVCENEYYWSDPQILAYFSMNQAEERYRSIQNCLEGMPSEALSQTETPDIENTTDIISETETSDMEIPDEDLLETEIPDSEIWEPDMEEMVTEPENPGNEEETDLREPEKEEETELFCELFSDQSETAKYDVNESGNVDINDVQWLYNMLQKHKNAELTEEEISSCDLDGNQIFDMDDLHWLMEYLNNSAR